jgi:hypothetical protein
MDYSEGFIEQRNQQLWAELSGGVGAKGRAGKGDVRAVVDNWSLARLIVIV